MRLNRSGLVRNLTAGICMTQRNGRLLCDAEGDGVVGDDVVVTVVVAMVTAGVTVVVAVTVVTVVEVVSFSSFECDEDCDIVRWMLW